MGLADMLQILTGIRAALTFGFIETSLGHTLKLSSKRVFSVTAFCLRDGFLTRPVEVRVSFGFKIIGFLFVLLTNLV